MKKRTWTVLGVALTAALLVGCIEKRVDWSPNGRWATVIGHEGALHISDGEGNLSKRIAPKVRRVAWFPDSTHVLVLRDVEAKTWDEVAAVLSPGLSEKLIAALGKGHLQGLVLQDPFRMGELAVRTIIAYCRDRSSKPPQRVDTGVRLATPENMHEQEIAALLRPPIGRYLNE